MRAVRIGEWANGRDGETALATKWQNSLAQGFYEALGLEFGPN
jgi:hypothetical protein